jgi:predicted regulator of Ras-like GTPase activity (Roadblock/LC7/MglB family)
MSFLAHLESIVRQVDGAIAASVMGFDGIAVETHKLEDPADLELWTLWIEYSNVLGQLRRAAETLKTGELTEVAISTDKVLTLARTVSPEYFLILALKPTGNYGKGRYMLRLAAPQVRAEL